MERLPIAFHPGEDLLEAIEAKGWTQRQFAQLIGISAPYLSDIIKGRRSITASLAVRIGAAFGTSAEVWLNLQSNYDLFVAEKEEAERIATVHEKIKELAYA
jgi:addiction module antidote protein HigA|uniref:Plasmid maintenance system antidote protein n=1 Tax=Podoviridae sp. cttxo15 TaxID=2826584 RepID=A0A8S5N2E7_9CAUD|nr:MAG TPA: Plasmid maintenance system antidote protein [Podoviridae sp. cttxo15]